VVACFVVAALSIHSFMAGVSLGAVEGARGLGVLLAILSHKGLAAFALGSHLVSNRVQRCRFMVILFSFSCATPVGIIAGMKMTGWLDPVTSGLITACVSGTFIFVSIVDILQKEMLSGSDVTPKLFCTMGGWAVMTILALWI
jgi:zinc transporter 1/2/3